MESISSYSLSQRLRSWRNAASLLIARRLRLSTGVHRETPALALQGLAPLLRERIDALAARYQVRFEMQASQATSLRNYEYLDLLDAAIPFASNGCPARGSLHDVGSANFWYAASLERFFRPAQMTGFETEGYRRYLNGHTRRDCALGYAETAGAGMTYQVQDYRTCTAPADIITAWFPFLTPEPLLAWGLRLQDLDPAGLIARIAENLTRDGVFFMVNHGEAEAELGARLCREAGLRAENRHIYRSVFKDRALPPVATCWRYSGTSCILRRGS